MNRYFFAFLFFVFASHQVSGQSDCIDADPFCTGTSYTFNNSTNVANLGAVDCLGSTPNPTWYYMEVNQNGQMGFTISQTGTSGGGLDVDFALWGPYSSLAAGCGNPFPNGTPIDCSYSTAATENVTIPNAQVGETYILLITNFSNQPGTITFSQTSGSGSADCSFTCGVNMTAVVGACNSNLYDINGTLTVSAGPGISVPNSGTLTISNSCGGSQTFNAPFTNIPYSFTGLNANGGACTITASFSNFPNCNTFVQYDAPPSCDNPCNISGITAGPSACVNGSYDVSGAITFTNAPTTGTLTVTGSCGGTQTFSAPFTSPINYNLPGLNANGAGCTVTATFSDNPTCTNTANYTAPAPCACAITSLTALPSVCSNNLFDLTGSVVFSNAPSTGSLTVTNSCGGTQTFNAPFVSPIPYSFTGLAADGSSCSVTASFTSDAACTTQQNFTAPAACNTTPCVTEPFCTGNVYTFPAGVNQTDASITYPNNNYGCLGSSPNPAWYYMEIDQGGNLGISMTNSSGVDIDFILYGPYTDYNQAMSYCNNMGTGTSGSNINTVVDCSFSTAANETANIATANPGDVYVLLITNFSNAQTNITFSGSGSATTDCSIVGPVCTFTGFTGSTSNCDATTNTYSFSGTIDFIDPPATGTLTLSNSCGGVQTFTAPFGTSQSFTFTNLPADGSPCTITAGFSDDGSCSATLDYTAVPSCNCPAEVGTYTPDVIGNSNTLTILCFGDTIDIVSDNNWTAPDEIVGATDPTSPNYDPSAPIYDPGIAWLIYSCPPSVAVTPTDAEATNTDINDDPCLLGVVGNTPDIWDVNDLSLINALPAGTFTNNTVYFVPITMYSLQDGIYSYVVLPALQCYELGTPIAVQYLPEITSTQTQNCANGTVSVTVNGGSPALNGNNFNIDPSSLTPNTASVVGGTTSNGGTLSIGNLQDGAYSFDVVDDNGCPITISGTFVGPQSASISYQDNLYCVTDPNPNPTQTGTNGGSYSSGPGLSLDANTGEINLANSTPGSYTITYTTPGPDCPATSSYSLIIDENPVVDAGPDVTVCYGNQVTLVAEGAEFYTWNMGLENGVPYLPSIGINEFDVVGVNAAGCIGYDTVIVEVLDDCFPDDELIFWVPNTFTPDNDQYNQNWNVVFYSGIDPLSFELYVFNRWGEIVWESRNPEIGWDGTYFNGRKCPDGVYTWKIKFKRVQTDEKRTAVGHVNVLR